MGGHAPNEDYLLDIVRRLPVLAELRDGPRTRRDLETSLDTSKTTVHRATTTLEEHGLLKRECGAYQLTTIGETVAGEAVSFADRATAAGNLTPLFERTDGDFSALEPELFTEANVTTASPERPYAPMRRFMAILREAGHVRWIGRGVLTPGNQTEITERIRDGLDVDVIIEPGVVRRLTQDSAEFDGTLHTLDNVSVHVHEELPFSLLVTDDHVGVGGYDPQTGALSVYVDATEPDALAWGASLFESYHDRARPISETSIVQREPVEASDADV